MTSDNQLSTDDWDGSKAEECAKMAREIEAAHKREALLIEALSDAKRSPEIRAGLQILDHAEEILAHYATGARKARAFDWVEQQKTRGLLWAESGEGMLWYARDVRGDWHDAATLLEAVEKAMGV